MKEKERKKKKLKKKNIQSNLLYLVDVYQQRTVLQLYRLNKAPDGLEIDLEKGLWRCLKDFEGKIKWRQFGEIKESGLVRVVFDPNDFHQLKAVLQFCQDFQQRSRVRR
jgi:UV DNA damage repair endonuclease